MTEPNTMGTSFRLLLFSLLLESTGFDYTGGVRPDITRTIPIVEACYRIPDRLDEWMRGVKTELEKAFSPPDGMMAMAFDASDLSRPVALGPALTDGVDPEFVATMRPSTVGADGLSRHEAFPRSVLCATVREVTRAAGQEYSAQYLGQAGFEDILGLYASGPDGRGVVFSMPLRKTVAVDEVLHRKHWTRLSVHLAAGFRLQRRVQEQGELTADATLDGQGRVLEAAARAEDRATQTILREAVASASRARGEEKARDPERALDLWKGLIEGEWSLVDRFESDGRRLIVVCRNEPECGSLRALTKRERQVVAFVSQGHSNALIAYELGIAEGTVGAHLNSACRKLGLPDRLALIRAYGSLASRLKTA